MNSRINKGTIVSRVVEHLLAGEESVRKSRPMLIEALEPRVLFSGSPAPAADPAAAPAAEPEPVQEAAPVSETSSEEVLSDSSGQAPVATPPPASDDGVANSNGGYTALALTEEEVAVVAEAAAQRWMDTGLSEDQLTTLSEIDYSVSDLDGGKLGSASGNEITIDIDAAGLGWFVDSTPLDDEEFDSELVAGDGEASFGIDLLTTILHEQGHILGLPEAASGLMDEFIGTGTRRLPVEGILDDAGSGAPAGESYLTVLGSPSFSGDDMKPISVSGNMGSDQTLFENTLTKACCNGGTRTVDAEFRQAFILTEFALTSGGDRPGRDPDQFTIQGSNDGTNWTQIFSYDTPSLSPWGATPSSANNAAQRNTTILFSAGVDYALPQESFSFYRYQVTSNVTSTANPVGSENQLAEIEYFGTIGTSEDDVLNGTLEVGRVNLAFNGTATQSTTSSGGVAGRAIDGNISGNYAGADSTTHTGNSAFSFWEVDLGESSGISEIVLFNRSDCCGSRLGQFRVSIFDASGAEVFFENHPGNVGQGGNVTFDVEALAGGPVIGQRVRIAIDPASAAGDTGMNGDGLNSQGGILSLAEVQVFGEKTVTSANGVPVSGGPVTFTSSAGAQVTVNPDGSYTYDPDGQFDYLLEGQSTTDTFTVSFDNGGASPAPELYLDFANTSGAPVDLINGTVATVFDNPNQGAPGIDGSGIDFDGVNDFLEIAAPAGVSAGELSIVTWFNGPAGSWNDFWGFQTSSGAHYTGEIRGDGNASGYDVGAVPGAVEVSASGADLSSSGWHQIAYTFSESTGEANIFVDGILRGQASGWAATEAITSFRIANDFRGEPRHIDGAMDEFMVFNEALTATQLLELFDAPGDFLGEETVTVTVVGANEAPVATDDTNSTVEGTPVSGNVIADLDGAGPDSDPDNTVLNLVTPTSVTLDVGSEFYPVIRLIDDAGLAALDATNYQGETIGGGSGETWVTNAFGADYYGPGGGIGPDPVMTFGLGSAQKLTHFVYWGYSGINNEAKEFQLEFSNDGGSTFSAPVTVSSDVRAGYGQITLDLGGTFEADTVRLTMTDNHYLTPGGAGGDRVGLGEVKFLSIGELTVAGFDGVTDPSTDIAGIYGSLDWEADGSYTYSPTAELPIGSFTEVFTYTLQDPSGDTDTADLTIHVLGQNDAPVAADDSFAVSEDDGNATLGNVITGSDSDPDPGDVLGVISVEGAESNVGTGITLGSGAIVSIGPDGTIQYDPNGMFESLTDGGSATDTFTYTITDGNSLADGLIFHTRLDEGAGATTAEDISGNGLDGAIGSSVGVGIPGQVNGAFDFDSTGNGRVVVGNPGELSSLTSNFTVSAWINPDNVSGVQRVFTNDAGGGFGFGLNGSGIRFTTYGVKDYQAGNVSAGTWTHIAAVMDDNFDVEFFVNGVSVGTVTHGSGGNVSPNDFAIGGRPGGFEGFDGQIDDVAVWGRALTAEEIALVAGGSPLASFQEAATATVTVTVNGVNDLPVATDNANSATEGGAAVSGNLILDDDGFGVDSDAEATPKLIHPGTVTLNVGSEFYSAQRLIDDTGLDGLDVTNYQSATIGGGAAETWVTNAFGADYYGPGGGVGPDPVATFGLGATEKLTHFVYWGYANNNNEAKEFQLEFSTDGGATFNGAVTVSSDVRAGFGQITLPLGGAFEADTVRITMTDNHYLTPGAAGGDRVGLGEVKFIGYGGAELTVSGIDGVTDPSADVAGTYGTLNWETDGSYTYTPGTNVPIGVSEDVFTYTVMDEDGGTDTAQLTVTITGENDAPQAVDDSFGVSEDDGNAVLGNIITGSDSDTDLGDILSVFSVEGSGSNVGTAIALGSGAVVTVDPDGSLQYDPNGMFESLADGDSATDTFTYTISDSNSLTNGLVLHTRLDEGAGATTAGDISGNGLDGAIGSSVGVGITGQVNGAFDFDGSGTGLVTIGNPAELSSLTQNITVAAWINPDRLSGIQRVFGNNSNGGFGFGLNGDNLRFTTYNVRDYDIAATVPQNSWTHIAAVMDGNNDVEFFINGVSIGTITHGVPGRVSNTDFQIGGRPGGFEGFDGQIDDVGVWSRPLTVDEILSLAATGPDASFQETSTATVTVTVTGENDAPLLDPLKVNEFADVAVNDFDNDGDLVADLLNKSVDDATSDVDNGALPRGIAVIGETGTGYFEFSTDDGLSWNLVDAAADDALLLLDTARIRYVPDGVNFSQGTLSFRAWDQFTGSEGDRVDLSLASSVGGTTAFSADAATSTVAVANLVLDGDTLIYGATNGEVNRIQLSIDSDQLVIKDLKGHPISGSIGTGSGSNMVMVPLSSFTNLQIDTGDEDDVIDVLDLGTFAGELLIEGMGGFDTINYSDKDLVLGVDNSATFIADTINSMVGSSLATGPEGGIAFYADRNVNIDPGAALAAGLGGLVIEANIGGVTSGNFRGIDVNGASLTTENGGDIILGGTGGDSGGYNTGVYLYNSDVNASGQLDISGQGGDGVHLNNGVNIVGGVATAAGDVTITGTGGGTGNINSGIAIDHGAVISSTAGMLTISGEAGAGVSNNIGVAMNRGGTLSGLTGVTIAGTGAGTGSNNRGVYLTNNVVIDAGNGALLVEGTGSNTALGLSNAGVELLRVSASAGTTTDIAGEGGTGSHYNKGVALGSFDLVAGGAVSVVGTGGDATGNANVGISLGNSSVTAGGAVSLTGQATGGMHSNAGVTIAQLSSITGDGITVLGTGAGTGSYNVGVQLIGATLDAGAGALDIAGTGSADGTGTGNHGVEVRSSSLTGSSASAIVGTGGEGSNSFGAYMVGVGGSLVASNVMTDPDTDDEKVGDFFNILPVIPLVLAGCNDGKQRNRSRRVGKVAQTSGQDVIFNRLFERVAECDGLISDDADFVPVLRLVDGMLLRTPLEVGIEAVVGAFDQKGLIIDWDAVPQEADRMIAILEGEDPDLPGGFLACLDSTGVFLEAIPFYSADTNIRIIDLLRDIEDNEKCLVTRW